VQEPLTQRLGSAFVFASADAFDILVCGFRRELCEAAQPVQGDDVFVGHTGPCQLLHFEGISIHDVPFALHTMHQQIIKRVDAQGKEGPYHTVHQGCQLGACLQLLG
jgi:hypothetical protein